MKKELRNLILEETRKRHGNYCKFCKEYKCLLYVSTLCCANMCECMYSVLAMHIDKQAITPLRDRRATMGK